MNIIAEIDLSIELFVGRLFHSRQNFAFEKKWGYWKYKDKREQHYATDFKYFLQTIHRILYIQK